MGKKFRRLILSSQDNSETHHICEGASEDTRRKIKCEVSHICFEDLDTATSSDVIQNLARSGLKGERNKRYISMTQKKYNQTKFQKNHAKVLELNTKAVVQSSINSVVYDVVAVDTWFIQVLVVPSWYMLV